jgi:hypothetical protein
MQAPPAVRCGNIVRFTDKYDGDRFGVVVELDDALGTYIRGERGMTVWCPEDGKAYGMRECRARVIAGFSAAARLANLLESEAHTRDVYAYYPAWQGRMMIQCPYRFYGAAIDAAWMEVHGNAV